MAELQNCDDLKNGFIVFGPEGMKIWVVLYFVG